MKMKFILKKTRNKKLGINKFSCPKISIIEDL